MLGVGEGSLIASQLLFLLGGLGKLAGFLAVAAFAAIFSGSKVDLFLIFLRAQFPGPQRCAVERPMTCAKTAKACKSMNTTPDPPYMWLDANASTCTSAREDMPLTVNISSIHIGERRALAWGSQRSRWGMKSQGENSSEFGVQ